MPVGTAGSPFIITPMLLLRPPLLVRAGCHQLNIKSVLVCMGLQPNPNCLCLEFAAHACALLILKVPFGRLLCVKPLLFSIMSC